MKRLLKIFSFIGMLTIMTGCLFSKYTWQHPVKPQNYLYKDKMACEERATRMANNLYPHPSSANIIVNTNVAGEQTKSTKLEDPYQYTRVTYKDRMVRECLYGEGWQQVYE